MQAARIWFEQKSPAFTLSLAGQLFEQMGLNVSTTKWQLEEFVIPQLLIEAETPFLIQFDDFKTVAEEAKETAEFLRDDLPSAALAKLRRCDSRFDVGGPEDDVNVVTDEGMFVFAGIESVDPLEPQVNGALRLLTKAVDGVFEDNINGGYWFP